MHSTSYYIKPFFIIKNMFHFNKSCSILWIKMIYPSINIFCNKRHIYLLNIWFLLLKIKNINILIFLSSSLTQLYNIYRGIRGLTFVWISYSNTQFESPPDLCNRWFSDVNLNIKKKPYVGVFNVLANAI